MQVTVHYLAQLRQAAGRPSEPIVVDEGITVDMLLSLVADRHGDPFRALILGEQNRIHPSLLVFVGDEAVDRGVVLNDGDMVTILTPMAGGCA